MSYYVTIAGKQYDRALYEAALEAVEGQGDGRISRADAEKLVAKALDAGPGVTDAYTEVEKRTVKLIRDTMGWTDAADAHFRQEIRSAAAKRSWEIRAAQARGDDPVAKPIDAIVAEVCAELGLPEMKIDISAPEVEGQLAEFGGTVGFEAALRAALESFLHDGEHVESPVGIMTELMYGGPFEGMTDPEEAAHVFMNRPTTRLALVRRKDYEPDANLTNDFIQPPEHRESIADNWVFLLRIDSLSDHLQWAIVDRAGDRATFNYGFN